MKGPNKPFLKLKLIMIVNQTQPVLLSQPHLICNIVEDNKHLTLWRPQFLYNLRGLKPEVVRYPHFEVPYPTSNGDNKL